MTEAPKSVFVVDDNDAVRSVIVRMLTHAGYGVVDTADPAEAIDLVTKRRQPIDLAIVDAVLPEPGCPAVVEALREHLSPLRVLVISGYDPIALQQMPRFEAIMALNGFKFLGKPFELRELTAAVADLLTVSVDEVRVMTGEWQIP